MPNDPPFNPRFTVPGGFRVVNHLLRHIGDGTCAAGRTVQTVLLSQTWQLFTPSVSMSLCTSAR